MQNLNMSENWKKQKKTPQYNVFFQGQKKKKYCNVKLAVQR